MRPKRSTSISKFAMVVTLGVSSIIVLSEADWRIGQAQESETTVRIDNLTRMAPFNQALKKRYETQVPEASVEINTQQPDAPLQQQGQQSDLAAISRFLTDEEKAQGLVQVPVTREKIAIVVGQDNPFVQGLTIDQVVQIFQGEITNWSQVGGPSAPIRVLHRPIASNLQSTLQTYDLFQSTSFQAGGQIVQLDQNDLSVLTEALGKDGISYALASQISDAEAIRPVSMYNTLPDDPRYPFSQPFTYVYQGTPTASAQTFLDFVASSPGQEAVAEAKTQPAISDDADVKGLATETEATETKSNPESAENAQTDDPSSVSSDSSAAPSSEGTDANSSTVASSSTETADEAKDASGGLGWLPIALIVLVLGGLVGGVLKTLFAKSKAKPAPRPAPNYAEKIRPTRIQATTTALQETPNPEVTMPEAVDESNPLSTDHAISGAAAAGAVNVMAAAETNSETTLQPPETEPQVPEIEPQPTNEPMDITSNELKAQTRIQNPKTELQDTPPSQRSPKTQLQDPTITQLQAPDSKELAENSTPQNIELNPTQISDPWESHPTQLDNPSATQLQDPSLTQLQESNPTQLQDPNSTQLQDSNPTQLQDPSLTQLQDPSLTQLQESNPTQLQDPNSTQLQDPSLTQLQDSNPTQLQDSSWTQLQEPQQAWEQDADPSFGLDPSPTSLQDPNPTQLQDPRQTWSQDDMTFAVEDSDSPQGQDARQTWIQSEDFPEGVDPQVSQTLDPKQTWIQDDEEG